MHRWSWLLVLLLSALMSKSIAEEDELCDEEPDEPDVCPFDTTGDATNVAVGKTAEQSSQYAHGGTPNLAVDGNVEQHFWGGLSCTHTIDDEAGEPKPWLRVDLGSAHIVQSVKLYSREDSCCGFRTHDVEIRVGNEKEGGFDNRFHRNGLCDAAKGGGYPAGKIFEFNCPTCLAGRYVSVQIVKYCDDCEEPAKNVLAICELQIYGYKV